MKLAELLIERSEITRRIMQLSSRINHFAILQEGDVPPVHPESMLETVEELHTQLEQIIININHTNNNSEFEAGTTMSEAIVQRDTLKNRQGIYSSLIRAIQPDSRHSRNEIRYVTTVDLVKVISKADELAKAIRIIDSKIQKKNWEIEVQ